MRNGDTNITKDYLKWNFNFISMPVQAYIIFKIPIFLIGIFFIKFENRNVNNIITEDGK